MIIEALNRLFSSNYNKGNKEEHQVITAPGVVEKAEVENDVPTENRDKDIEALEERFGILRSGMTIELSLHEAQSIMPRERKRTDAYKGLVGRLSRVYGVTLIIGGENKKRQGGKTNDKTL